jgi:DNA-binding transcriptional regulator YhcF (GntR family)
MEFILESHSALPPHTQIQEQVKLALLLGRLRPGDTLPSIREVEALSGLSRNLVHKAYLALHRSGILTLRHGKGVIVAKNLTYSHDGKLMEQCEALSREILLKVERIGISPTSFARYLYQKAREQEGHLMRLVFVDATAQLARERAAKISSFWQVSVPGVSIDDLAKMDPKRLKQIRIILTNYFRYDQVRRIARRFAIDVIPLSLTFAQPMLQDFDRLSAGASVALILDDRDYPSLSLILESYRRILVNPHVKLMALPLSRVSDLHRFVRSSKFDRVVVSNRIWDRVPDKLRKNRRLTRPLMEIDLASLESARIKAGVII